MSYVWEGKVYERLEDMPAEGRDAFSRPQWGARWAGTTAATMRPARPSTVRPSAAGRPYPSRPVASRPYAPARPGGAGPASAAPGRRSTAEAPARKYPGRGTTASAALRLTVTLLIAAAFIAIAILSRVAGTTP